jgi:hypothetical protein
MAEGGKLICKENAMVSQQEYPKNVKQWIPATVAVFAVFSFAAFATCSSQAQSSAGHASASSSGSHAAASSHPTSVTSTRPTPVHPARPVPPNRRYLYGGVYAVGVPVGAPADSANEPSDDANYQGGPTIFDRRGSGAPSYIPPVANAPDPHPHRMAQSDPQSEGESEADPTMLIFKDGHQLEVGNYAIVGHNLYDMSPGHSGKVALADIDVTATQKQNEQHGVKFQVPASALAN